MKRAAVFIARCAVLFLLTACGGQDRPASEADDKPAPEKRKNLSASRRMLGKWEMDLTKTPDTALTEDFVKFKQQGHADKVTIVYTITDSEFILDKWGIGGRRQSRWYYEILNESGNALMLKRTDEHGRTQEVPAAIEGEVLKIGTGNGIVPLRRVQE